MAVLTDGPATAENVGGTPWSTPHPMVLDMSAAERELGSRPVTTYMQSLPAPWSGPCALGDQDWRAAFPRMAQIYGPGWELFDYAAKGR